MPAGVEQGHTTSMNNMKMTTKFATFLSLIVITCITFIVPAEANHLRLDGFEVVDMDQALNRITYKCDIKWDNSWRNSTNYDAVWVFLKYSTDGGQTWYHASMSSMGTNPTGFQVPSGFEAIVPADKKGFFLQRTDFNSGNVNASEVKFVWDYSQDGLSDEVATAANTINKIFGIEMVYIPQGAFYLGDGNSSSDARFIQGSSDNDPWYISSENPITTTNLASDGFYYQSAGAIGENASASVFLVPSSFPKGHQAFYQMKYELTEGQWVSFFNTLTAAQKNKRDITAAANGGKGSDNVVNRNTVSWDSSEPTSVATTLRSDRPMTYLSWADMAAYADWAALRPMTEMEFEKAARGKDIVPVADEYAWGTTSYNTAEPGEIYPDTDENGEEVLTDGSANINRNSLGWTSGDGRSGGIANGQTGPVRVGIFARPTTNRVTSGAGYYGTMELSGNLHEMVVSLGNSEGRKFLGTHGDGSLSGLSSYEGNATNTDWPGINAADPARGVTGTVGTGYRGGDFMSSSLRHFQISTRAFASKDPDSEGYNQRYDASFGVFGGGRLVRTAP